MIRDDEPTAEQFAIQAALRTMIPQSEESPGEVGRLEGSLYEFIKAAWHVVEPSVKLIDNWHIEAISTHLQAVTDGRIKNLLINIPPGTSKSLLVSVFWPAWEWARNPSTRWMFASYDQKLSVRDSTRCRYLLQSQWYQNRWGHRVQFAPDSNLKTYYENTARGYRLATSVGGHATGEHPGRVVCFPAGTKVTTDKGETPIEKMQVNDYNVRVLTVGVDGHQWENDYETSSREFDSKLIQLTFSSGRVLEATPDHLVFVVGRGYVKAKDLVAGCEVMTDEVSMQAVRKRVPREAQPQDTILFPSVLATVASRTEYSSVRDMREASLSLPVTRGARPGLLQPQMSWPDYHGRESSSVRWSETFMSGMREYHNGSLGSAANASEVLFAIMPTQSDNPQSSARKALFDSVRPMFNTDMDGRQASKTAASVLWEKMCRHRSSFIFDWLQQWPLQAWERARNIPRRIQRSGKKNEAKRRLLLSAVRQEQKGKQRESDERSSYRYQYDEQLPEQSHQPLRIVSLGSSWRQEARNEMAKDTVVDVSEGRYCKTVYCLKVNGSRNYFANGILVHNCDDPHSVGRVESADQRQTVIDWWDNTISTRGVSGGVSKVVIMQRLHQKDLAGYILSKYSDWDHINLAMRYEIDSMKKPTSIGWIDPRVHEGELLTPKQFTEKMVTSLEQSLGSYGTAAQLQQRPSPKGGGLLQRDWFKFVGEAPQGPSVRRCRYWDFAATEKKTSDYTVGAKLSVAVDDQGLPKFYIENLERDRWSPARRDARMKATAELDGRGVPIRMEQEGGASGISLSHQMIRMLAGWDIRGLRVTGSKVTRMQGFASQAEIGNVYIVRPPGDNPPLWIEAMLDEFESFPTGEHDDCVDACSGAFNYLYKPEAWHGDDIVTSENLADVGAMDDDEREEYLDSMNAETRAFFEDSSPPGHERF